jgi:hypothetical protein
MSEPMCQSGNNMMFHIISIRRSEIRHPSSSQRMGHCRIERLVVGSL